MSALRDWDFPVHFYFGNASQDLSHLMPVEDEAAATTDARPLEARLSHIESLIDKLASSQEHISFFLRDIMRLTG